MLKKSFSRLVDRIWRESSDVVGGRSSVECEAI
jgi:hypothetical protein